MVIVVVYVPTGSPEAVAAAETVAGPAPLAGLTESHDAPDVAVQPSVPPPPFETPTLWAVGSGPPTDAAKAKLAGLTTRTGANDVVPYAAKGPSLYPCPVVHVAGSVLSVVCEFVSAALPPPQQRSRNASVPFGERSAIQ